MGTSGLVGIAAIEYPPDDLLPEYLIRQAFPRIASLILRLPIRNG